MRTVRVLILRSPDNTAEIALRDNIRLSNQKRISLLDCILLTIAAGFLIAVIAHAELGGTIAATSPIIGLVAYALQFRPKSATKQLKSDELPKNGHDFERWVAEKLKEHGWRAEVTPASGDQGIDVIMTRSGTENRFGLQCKLSSRAVGNKAVQEAVSGRIFHQLDHVGVISNSNYTKSALDLAWEANVELYTIKDIPKIWDQYFE